MEKKGMYIEGWNYVKAFESYNKCAKLKGAAISFGWKRIGV